MNKMLKKCVAFTAAMSMVMAPCTVFASETTPAADPDKVEAGGSAGVEYYPNEVKKVGLPTAAALSTPFTIDPQGALSIASDGDTVDAAAVGAVVPQEIVYIKNESSFSVNVKTDLYVTKDASSGEASSVSLLAGTTAPASLATSTKNEIWLNVYSTSQVGDSDKQKIDAYNKDHQLISKPEFASSVNNIVANGKANAMELSYVLKEAEYELTQQGSKKNWFLKSGTDNYSQVAFCIGGNVAQKADWSKYGSDDDQEEIILKAIFTLEEAAEGPSTGKVAVSSSPATAPGFLSDTSVYGGTVVAGTKEATVENSYVIDDAETDLVLPIDFGKGGKKVTVTSANITQGSGNVQLVEGTDYEVTSSGITLKDSSETLWCLEWPATSTLWVGCADADGVETWLGITFTTAEN